MDKVFLPQARFALVEKFNLDNLANYNQKSMKNRTISRAIFHFFSYIYKPNFVLSRRSQRAKADIDSNLSRLMITHKLKRFFPHQFLQIGEGHDLAQG